MSHADESEKKNELNEPSVSYGSSNKKRIHIYQSFEEMAQAEIVAEAARSPVERLRQTVQLILRVYGVTQEDLNNRKRTHKITITKYE